MELVQLLTIIGLFNRPHFFSGHTSFFLLLFSFLSVDSSGSATVDANNGRMERSVI